MRGKTGDDLAAAPTRLTSAAGAEASGPFHEYQTAGGVKSLRREGHPALWRNCTACRKEWSTHHESMKRGRTPDRCKFEGACKVSRECPVLLKYVRG